MLEKKVKLTQSARKRCIGKAHVIAAIGNAGEPVRVPPAEGLDERLLWIGADDRGLLLEIIGIELAETLVIIHVMPYRYRGR